MRVLGIDPSLACTGLVLVDGDRVEWFDVVQTAASDKMRHIYQADDDWRRCWVLADRIVKAYHSANQVNAIAVEVPTGGSKSSRAAHAMGMAKGTVAAALSPFRGPVVLITPAECKLAAAGSATATKAEVQAGVFKALTWQPGVMKLTKPHMEAVCDAAATALAARERW